MGHSTQDAGMRIVPYKKSRTVLILASVLLLLLLTLLRLCTGHFNSGSTTRSLIFVIWLTSTGDHSRLRVFWTELTAFLRAS